MQLPPPLHHSPTQKGLFTHSYLAVEKRVAQTCRVSLTSTRQSNPAPLHLPRLALALPRHIVVLWLFTHLHIICVGWRSKGKVWKRGWCSCCLSQRHLPRRIRVALPLATAEAVAAVAATVAQAVSVAWARRTC